MDADGLPLLGTGIDLYKVEPLNQKQTLAHINQFVIRTAQFLNKFSSVCEEKLEVLSIRMRQLEISMNILEAKLSSIPGLDDIQAAPAPPQTMPAPPSAPVPNLASQPASQPPAADTLPPVVAPVDENAADSEPAQTAAPGFVPVSQHDDYKPFFKLLQVGVPPQALKQKMVIQGLNPDLLDTPNAPAPAGKSGGASAPAVGNSKPQADDDDDDDFGPRSSESDDNSDMSD